MSHNYATGTKSSKEKLHKNDPNTSCGKEDQVIDLNNMVGRIKPKPICDDVNLKQEAMSSEELSKFAFPMESDKVSVVSSNSSTASRDSSSSISPSCVGGYLQRMDESERINERVKTQKSSRNGRQTQRWYTDPTTQRLYRMTTGCVPIVDDGKILFVSASRKSEWILPKGGWEKDEEMEESAIRETFEEAGVFGILGPVLKEIDYETRKAKKRRIEYEEVQRKAKEIRLRTTSSNIVSTDDQGAVAASHKFLPPIENEPSSKVEDQQKNLQHGYSDGDACSVVTENSLSYTHVKMSLFPLYVTEVRNEWPEMGRLRKIVDIDEAILMTESRPEFQKVLVELKQRNLHLVQKRHNPLNLDE